MYTQTKLFQRGKEQGIEGRVFDLRELITEPAEPEHELGTPGFTDHLRHLRELQEEFPEESYFGQGQISHLLKSLNERPPKEILPKDPTYNKTPPKENPFKDPTSNERPYLELLKSSPQESPPFILPRSDVPIGGAQDSDDDQQLFGRGYKQ